MIPALLGRSVFMLFLLALVVLAAEQMGEQSAGRIPRRMIIRAGVAALFFALAVNGVLYFHPQYAVLVLRFDLVFFALVPPFCFGLIEKARR